MLCAAYALPARECQLHNVGRLRHTEVLVRVAGPADQHRKSTQHMVE